MYRAFSLSQHLCTFIGTKESVYREKSLTPTRLVCNTNMAAVSLFWNTNIAAVTSCENALCTELHKLKSELHKLKSDLNPSTFKQKGERCSNRRSNPLFQL